LLKRRANDDILHLGTINACTFDSSGNCMSRQRWGCRVVESSTIGFANRRTRS
jgi:hypothetical protein